LTLTALRWLYIAVTAAVAYVIHLVYAHLADSPVLPPRLNTLALDILVAGVVIAAVVVVVLPVIGRIERRLDAITNNQAAHGAHLDEITRDLPIRGVARVYYIPSDKQRVPSLPPVDTTYLAEAAEYYELGRQAGLATRDDPPIG
jgi:hypothetical protein